ncbi:MAG TPA: sugar phosphate nucleotidyltransferase, partial [Polyangiaceae bacterium]|nr:sugar phosphate nucleotidyltransferase [Polyangiaceae bacterium]
MSTGLRRDPSAGSLIGVIAAAGLGLRALPFTQSVPKCLLRVGGVPLIERNLLLLRDKLKIRDVRVVIGHHGGSIREHLGDGSRFGVRITYIENNALDRELAYSIYLGCRGTRSACCVLLGDEYYFGTNHEGLLRPEFRCALGVCTVIAGPSADQLRKNYSVTIASGRIADMREKPRAEHSHMGTGTFLLSAALVEKLERAFETTGREAPRVFTNWLAEGCR